MRTDEIIDRLRAAHPLKEFAFLEQVADGTGARRCRAADALAMSLWPSRGLTIVGFEVKCYRNDWLRELKSPEKAEPVASYCDYWIIVTGDSRIARLEEIPQSWGLWVADKEAGFDIVKQPAKLFASPLDRTFLASILRSANKASADPRIVKEAYDKGFRAGYERAGGRSGQAIKTIDEARSRFSYALGSVISAAEGGLEELKGIKQQLGEGVLDGGDTVRDMQKGNKG